MMNYPLPGTIISIGRRTRSPYTPRRLETNRSAHKSVLSKCVGGRKKLQLCNRWFIMPVNGAVLVSCPSVTTTARTSTAKDTASKKICQLGTYDNFHFFGSDSVCNVSHTHRVYTRLTRTCQSCTRAALVGAAAFATPIGG